MATLYHQVWINAPRTKVYEALATAEGLSHWWAPHTSKETAEGLVLAHSPGEGQPDVEFRVLERTPNERIEWETISRHPKESPASAWTGTHIAFELSERPSPGPWLGMDNEGETMTVLDFRHSGWDEKSPFLGFCTNAWGLALEGLRTRCEEGELAH